VVIVTRAARDADPARLAAAVRPWAPAATIAVARHEPAGASDLAGAPVAAAGRARVVTATGNPGAVAATAREMGFEVSSLAAYRDHHWFTAAEAASELAAARREGARLLLTSKDAVRWPATAPEVAVIAVAWRWMAGGATVERRVLGQEAE